MGGRKLGIPVDARDSPTEALKGAIYRASAPKEHKRPHFLRRTIMSIDDVLPMFALGGLQVRLLASDAVPHWSLLLSSFLLDGLVGLAALLQLLLPRRTRHR